MKNTRRQFLIMSAAGAATLSLNNLAHAQAMVAETDPQAQALGYKADTTKVDAKKYPKHAATQRCDNCALWQAKGAAAAGGCSLFAGKQVAAAGWYTLSLHDALPILFCFYRTKPCKLKELNQPSSPKQSTIQQQQLAYQQTGCNHRQQQRLWLARVHSYRNAEQQRA